MKLNRVGRFLPISNWNNSEIFSTVFLVRESMGLQIEIDYNLQ